MKHLARGLFFIFSVLFLSSCGYHAGYGGIVSSYHTITVPYAKGDTYGELTAALIQEIGACGLLNYQNEEAELILRVELDNPENRNIGFRFDRRKNKQLSERLIQSEGRLSLRSYVQVIDASNGELLLEPLWIEESLDFDHDFYSSRDEINVLSLGQVNEIEESKQVAIHALYGRLAKKIVSYLNNIW